ncbi:hypothetical protein KGA66_13055 [Actinocrinis puniceicyclus]|uniref:Uncharacterized protein n=1 Tax=Actinocrinis puniceicyclus TaxID=977794 RepID=A0A8J7WME4_9ACTN|nr:hypothetical protein [Actinocrinis puniceicyclus]MBS2963978.1 hypothetical protein [Actinocrinis puniceicyclus]
MGRFTGLGWFVAMGLLALLLAPVVLLAGEPTLERHRYSARAAATPWGRRHRGPLTAARYRVNLALFHFALHPFVIALTAPARWVRTRLHHLLRSRSARRRDGGGGRHERLFPDDPGFLGGVREPRRPNPAPPADAVALRPPTD